MICFIESQLSELNEFAAKEKLEIVNVRRSRSEFIHPHEASRALRGEQTPFELSSEYTAKKVRILTKRHRK